jgi:16S rRNA (cytidine1402-2'-O)-methyltransferase
VFYEAPHRLLDCIDDFCVTFGRERDVVIARELTKVHETLYRGSLGEVAAAIKVDPNAARGEIVIVLAGAPASDEQENERRALDMIPVLTQHLSRAQAIKVAAEITGAKRNRLYALIGHGSVD